MYSTGSSLTVNELGKAPQYPRRMLCLSNCYLHLCSSSSSSSSVVVSLRISTNNPSSLMHSAPDIGATTVEGKKFNNLLCGISVLKMLLHLETKKHLCTVICTQKQEKKMETRSYELKNQ